VGEVARRLGKPLMPWQQYVADVIMEVDPDTGRLAYTEWRLTVPRQSGKSTLIMAKAMHRCTASGFFGDRQSVVYTAQTRKHARNKWEKDYAWQVQGSRTWGRLVDVRLGNGNEHMRFPNGSEWGIEAGTEKAGHGPTIDEAYIDEAFAQPDGRLEGAFSPSMITRPNKQLGIVSTAGWLDGSPYLLDKVRAGREVVELGMRERVAFFEWSADEDADPEDPATWWSCMPALGHTVTEEAVAGELVQRDRGDFRRAYLNQWVSKDESDDALFDLAGWATLRDVPIERPKRIAMAIAGSPDREWFRIHLAGERSDGRFHVQVLAPRSPGPGWVVEELLRLKREHRPVDIVMDGNDPAASLLPDIDRTRGLKVTTLTSKDVARAAGMFVDATRDGALSHGGGQLLDRSVADGPRASPRRCVHVPGAGSRL